MNLLLWLSYIQRITTIKSFWLFLTKQNQNLSKVLSVLESHTHLSCLVCIMVITYSTMKLFVCVLWRCVSSECVYVLQRCMCNRDIWVIHVPGLHSSAANTKTEHEMRCATVIHNRPVHILTERKEISLSLSHFICVSTCLCFLAWFHVLVLFSNRFCLWSNRMLVAPDLVERETIASVFVSTCISGLS